MFKSELGQIGEAVNLLERATQYINRNTGFLVYYNLSQIYDKIKDRHKVEECLQKALKYQPDHRFARHRLGVVMSQLGKYDMSIQIFDDLMRDELDRETGPTDTFFVACRAKITTLKKAKRIHLIKKAIEDAKNELRRWPHLASKANELEY